MHIENLPLGAYQTNCYLAWGDDSAECIVIDPGYEPGTVLTAAQRLGKKIAAILLTHGHFDHVGAVREIAADTDCLVYIHQQDLSLPPSFTAGPLYYTHTYDAGAVLLVAGLGIRVLHTPGHTPGSVCLLAEETLFSGDTLFAGSIGRTDFPGGSFAQMKQSLNRLKALPDNYRVLPGHGQQTTLLAEKQHNPYLQ